MRRLFTEKDIEDLAAKGIHTISVTKNDIITPAAKDKIKELSFTVVEGKETNSIETIYAKAGIKNPAAEKVIAIGSDHTGFKMKAMVSELMIKKGYKVTDVGTFDENSCDYPDFAAAVAKKVRADEARFGIVIDATGIPSAITANKIPGIRAATCYNEFSARSAREHNDANVIVLGAKALGEETIKGILNIFFSAKFLGDRHQRRLDKITALEKLYAK